MDTFEIVIIGQGPAGLSAAIYTARAGMKTLILGCAPKIAGDYDIDNYFGFPETISGNELIMRGKKQAERFGVEMRCSRVLSMHPEGEDKFKVTTEGGPVMACAVILATGVSRIRPGVDNITDYEGKGVSYCVSCDGFFYRDKKVKVLGEGTFAANQALELKQYTPRVSICTQGKTPDVSTDFLEKLVQNKISIEQKKITTLEGDNGLERVVYADDTREDVDGLFIAIGEASSLDFAASLGVTQKGVFIEADAEQKTNVPGVFAAGDCVGRFLQISVAVGEGAVAGRSAIGYVKKICR